MSITIADVEYVAKLAKLELEPCEKAEYTEKLNAILEYMQQLQELDTTDIIPTTHVLPLKNVFREELPQVEKTFVHLGTTRFMSLFIGSLRPGQAQRASREFRSALFVTPHYPLSPNFYPKQEQENPNEKRKKKNTKKSWGK